MKAFNYCDSIQNTTNKNNMNDVTSINHAEGFDLNTPIRAPSANPFENNVSVKSIVVVVLFFFYFFKHFHVDIFSRK